MRKLHALLTAVVLAFPASALAAGPLTPAAVQSTFGTGVAFNASNVGGKTYTVVLSADGTAKRTPKGSKTAEAGTWRAAGAGYCSKWGKTTAEQCYSIEQATATRYDVFNATNKLIAHWTK
jgi:hypothetical protein